MGECIARILVIVAGLLVGAILVAFRDINCAVALKFQQYKAFLSVLFLMHGSLGRQGSRDAVFAHSQHALRARHFVGKELGLRRLH